MTHSPKALALVKEFEGCRLTSYKDGGGIWTIGYGHTAGVHENQVCTEEQAEVWLDCDLLVADASVNRLVKVPLNKNEFDALVDFVYNVGGGNFQTSTLLKRLNAYCYSGAANEFEKWVHDEHGNVEQGLVRRRGAEKDLFLEPIDCSPETNAG